MRQPTRLLLAALLLLAPGCFHRRAGPEQPPITVKVANRGLLDVNVFEVGRGVRDRLGMVIAQGTGIFPLKPWQLSGGGDIQLRAEPIGARRGFTSEIIHPYPGDTVQWTLDTDLTRSWIVLR